MVKGRVHPWTISAPLRPTREVPRGRRVHRPEHWQDQRPDQCIRARAHLRGLGLQHRPLDLQPCALLFGARSRRQARVTPVAHGSAAPTRSRPSGVCDGGYPSAEAAIRHIPQHRCVRPEGSLSWQWSSPRLACRGLDARRTGTIEYLPPRVVARVVARAEAVAARVDEVQAGGTEVDLGPVAKDARRGMAGDLLDCSGPT